MEGNVNMKTLFDRSNRYKRLNEMIAKVTDPKLKSSLIKTRDEYWNRIQKLNKPNFTDEDYNQIKQEHERMDDFIIERYGGHITALRKTHNRDPYRDAHGRDIIHIRSITNDRIGEFWFRNTNHRRLLSPERYISYR